MTKDRYLFRKATRQEVPEVFALIMRRVAWMDTVGIQQWNKTKYDERYPPEYYEKRRKLGELFVLEDTAAKTIVCVGALFHRDVRWPNPAEAYYLHHLAAEVGATGMGSLFLEMAEAYTASRGKTYLRLDSAVGNRTLEEYYTSRGYTEAGRCVDGLYQGILRQKKLN